MGMAASQARLLTITARLADNELRSQTINNAKMRLSAQSSQASEKYINALNNARLQFSNYDASGDTVSQDLTYNALTAYSSYNTQYGLVNSANQILVSESEAAIFKAANGNLDAYLKAHGLEYTTTYFDEIGAIQNSNYPEPFDNISVENMKSWYESYNSYENSVEVEAFTKAQSEYVVALNNLIDASEDHFVDYLIKKPTGAYAVTYDSTNESYSLTNLRSSNSISFNVARLKDSFKDSNTFYGLTTLVNTPKNFISPAVQREVAAMLSNISTIDKYQYDITTGKSERVTYLDAKSEAIYSVDEDTAGGTTKHNINGLEITVNASGYVTAVNTNGLANEYSEEGTATVSINGPDFTSKNVSLEDYLKDTTFNVSAVSGGVANNIELEYELVKLGNKDVVYEHFQTCDQSIAADWLNNVFTDCMNTIVANANYENFAYWVLDQKGNPPEFDPFVPPYFFPYLTYHYGINLDKVTPCGETFSEVLENYDTAKDNFLTSIFDSGSVSTVEELMRNNATFTIDTGETILINADSLMDVDFVLQLIANSEQQFGLSLNAAESYNTIVKEHLMDELIELYGTPKYAWVDENDTANKGNADAKAQWYTNLFNRMQRGYKTLENGLASSKEWIEYALEAGIVSLEQVDKSFNWKGLDFRTCTKIIEVTDDAAVTAAEAEYNRAMNDIKAKDNIYDLELKNIDTEHTALQTEYDVIKGVIDKNISRTLKFNQSA